MQPACDQFSGEEPRLSIIFAQSGPRIPIYDSLPRHIGNKLQARTEAELVSLHVSMQARVAHNSGPVISPAKGGYKDFCCLKFSSLAGDVVMAKMALGASGRDKREDIRG